MLSAHDLHASLVHGYVRRTKRAAADTLEAAKGWAEPYDRRRAKLSTAFSLALDALALEAHAQGLSLDELTGRIRQWVEHEPFVRRDLERRLARRLRDGERPDPSEDAQIEAALSAEDAYGLEWMKSQLKSRDRDRRVQPDEHERVRRMLAAAAGTRAV